jgi:hypothetical protein
MNSRVRRPRLACHTKRSSDSQEACGHAGSAACTIEPLLMSTTLALKESSSDLNTRA